VEKFQNGVKNYKTSNNHLQISETTLTTHKWFYSWSRVAFTRCRGAIFGNITSSPGGAMSQFHRTEHWAAHLQW